MLDKYFCASYDTRSTTKVTLRQKMKRSPQQKTWVFLQTLVSTERHNHALLLKRRSLRHSHFLNVLLLRQYSHCYIFTAAHPPNPVYLLDTMFSLENGPIVISLMTSKRLRVSSKESRNHCTFGFGQFRPEFGNLTSKQQKASNKDG